MKAPNTAPRAMTKPTDDKWRKMAREFIDKETIKPCGACDVAECLHIEAFSAEHNLAVLLEAAAVEGARSQWQRFPSNFSDDGFTYLSKRDHYDTQPAPKHEDGEALFREWLKAQVSRG